MQRVFKKFMVAFTVNRTNFGTTASDVQVEGKKKKNMKWSLLFVQLKQ